MPFSQSPVTDTYSTHRLPACYSIETLTTVTGTNLHQYADAGMINLIPIIEGEGENKREASMTRPILTGAAVTTSATQLDARGVYVWEKTSSNTYYFACCGDKIYTSTDGATWTAVTTWTTKLTTPVGFTEFINSATNTKSLIIVDGLEGYIFTSNAAGTKITDADFPTPHLPFPVFIDGYLFLAKSGTGDIYNSNLNDASAWTAGSFISSELYPDDLQALVKINNYLLAIGTQGCEYFYDSANATGSPLARVEGASLPFGTYFPYSIASNKNTVVMLSNNNDGEVTLKIIEDLKHKEVPSFFLTSVLNLLITSTDPLVTTTLDFIWGGFLRIGTDLCYYLNTNANRASSSTDVTSGFFLVYHFASNKWVEFMAANRKFPITRSTSSGKVKVINYVLGWDTYTGRPFFATMGYPGASATDVLTNTSSGGNINVQIYTPLFDFGTMNQKYMHRFTIISSTLATASQISSSTVTWSDWYGASWSGSYPQGGQQTISISPSSSASTESYYPSIFQLGRFKQRAFLVSATSIYPIKFIAFEVDINKGQQ